MDVATCASLDSRKNSDLIVLPFWQKKEKPEPAASFTKLAGHLKLALDTYDFKAKEGETLVLYVDTKHEKRVALVGLGDPEKLTTERLRRVYAAITRLAMSKKLKSLNVLLPHTSSLSEQELVRGIIEGLCLANYAFVNYKTEKDKHAALVAKVTLIGGGKQTQGLAKKYATIAEGVYLARDLVNGNADEVTPQHLAKKAQALAKKHAKLKTTIFDKKRLAKQGFGLLLAVNRGSASEPALIITEYRGAPKSKEKTVIVGKGVTYDTGGLNLKPTGSMETMKCDMGGAACVLGVIDTAAKLGLKVNLVGVIPSTENSLSATSYKPGDVYKGYSGKTVEIGNTDAEGRLILADALAYAVEHFQPTRIIDFATLTSAIDIALGAETSGLMSNNDALADAIFRAGNATYERVWRMPVHEEYRDQLKSDIADIKNVGGRSAGAITAAIFLQEFIGKTPWAHLDIASTAYLNDARRYHPKNATGIGVRLMIDFLENL